MARILVCGGVTFPGRELVRFLAGRDDVAFVRVADKMMPSIACLSPEQTAAFNSDRVEYVQADLRMSSHVSRAFALPDGAAPFDFVFNLAAETRCGRPADEYKMRTLDCAVQVANAALEMGGLTKFIQLSSACVYANDRKVKRSGACEGDATAPWLDAASFQFQAEEALRAIEGLPLIVARTACVYGPGDEDNLMPRLVCGRIYLHLRETMRFLWDGKLKLSTVHSRDFAAALWHLAQRGDISDPVYNIADAGDTNQALIAKALNLVFKIKTAFLTSFVTKLAGDITADVNDKHMGPWAELCAAASPPIANTPLTPFMHAERLGSHHLFVSSRKLQASGFTFAHPTLTAELLAESVACAVGIGIFPPFEGGAASK